MSNVKEGDLAQVVKATASFQWTLGRVVKVGPQCCFSRMMPAWKFVDPLRHGAVMVACAPDSHLKRIDPLAEDQVREVRTEVTAPRPKRRRVISIEHA